MIKESRVSLDTTTILRGSLQLQRGINPQASKYQLKLYMFAKGILDDIQPFSRFLIPIATETLHAQWVLI